MNITREIINSKDIEKDLALLILSHPRAEKFIMSQVRNFIYREKEMGPFDFKEFFFRELKIGIPITEDQLDRDDLLTLFATNESEKNIIFVLKKIKQKHGTLKDLKLCKYFSCSVYRSVFGPRPHDLPHQVSESVYVEQKYSAKGRLGFSDYCHILDYVIGSNNENNSNLSFSDALKATAREDYRRIIDLNKKSQEQIDYLKANDGATETVYTFKNGYSFKRLIGKDSYDREGLLMKHCVASYLKRTESVIYSLRNPNNEPLLTVEMRDGRMIQACEERNAPSNKTKPYLDEFLKFKDVPLVPVQEDRGSGVPMHAYLAITVCVWSFILSLIIALSR